MNREQDKARDANLVRAGLDGNRHALQQLVELYHKPVYNIAYRVLNDREAAADATQTTFLLAFENLRSFDPKYKFFSWIYRIAINEALDQRKKRQRYVQVVQQEAQEAQAVMEYSGSALLPPTATVGPEDKAEDAETAATLQQVLANLQEDYRKVIILRHFSELSYEEIAGVLEIPVKTVRSRLYSARQVLKSDLSRAGFLPHG